VQPPCEALAIFLKSPGWALLFDFTGQKEAR
jgi:hypothetical protein